MLKEEKRYRKKNYQDICVFCSFCLNGQKNRYRKEINGIDLY